MLLTHLLPWNKVKVSKPDTDKQTTSKVKIIKEIWKTSLEIKPTLQILSNQETCQLSLPWTREHVRNKYIFVCAWPSVWLYYTLSHTVRNLEVYLDTIIPWITMSTFSADLCLFRWWRSWFHLSFCQGSNTTNLYRWVSLKQAGSPTDSTKECGSFCLWQATARPCKASAHIPPLVANPSSDRVQNVHPVVL